MLFSEMRGSPSVLPIYLDKWAYIIMSRESNVSSLMYAGLKRFSK